MKTQITEVNVIPIKPKNGLVAIASCVIDNKMYLGSIGIYTVLKGGFRITYPNKKLGGNSIDVYHPINREVGDIIKNTIIAKYEELISQ